MQSLLERLDALEGTRESAAIMKARAEVMIACKNASKPLGTQAQKARQLGVVSRVSMISSRPHRKFSLMLW